MAPLGVTVGGATSLVDNVPQGMGWGQPYLSAAGTTDSCTKSVSSDDVSRLWRTWIIPPCGAVVHRISPMNDSAGRIAGLQRGR